MGADFSGVRVHTGGQADTLNRNLSARAFTTGQDIFFKQGEYSPGSSGGRELLAHELTHVVQQNGDSVQTKLTVGAPGDRYEQEADSVARAVLQQEQQPKQQQTAQRQTVPEEEEKKKEPMQAKRDDGQVQRQAEEEKKKEARASSNEVAGWLGPAPGGRGEEGESRFRRQSDVRPRASGSGLRKARYALRCRRCTKRQAPY